MYFFEKNVSVAESQILIDTKTFVVHLKAFY